MDKTKHEKADSLRESIKQTVGFLGRIEDAIGKGRELEYSISFNPGGWFSAFSRESFNVALLLEKQRLESKLNALEKEYESL